MKRGLWLIIIISTILSLLITSLSCEQSTGSPELMITSFYNRDAEYFYETYGENHCICGDTFVFTITVERTKDTKFNKVYTVSISAGGKTRDSQDVVFTLQNQGAKTVELSAYSSQMCSQLEQKCEAAQAAYDDFESRVGWMLVTGQTSSLSYDEVKKLKQEETNLFSELNKWKRWIRGQGGYDTEFDEFCRKYVQLSVAVKSPTPTPIPTQTPPPTPKQTTTPAPTTVVNNIRVQGISATLGSGIETSAYVRLTLVNLSNMSQTYTLTFTYGSGCETNWNPRTLEAGQQITIEQPISCDMIEKIQVYLNGVFVGEVTPIAS